MPPAPKWRVPLKRSPRSTGEPARLVGKRFNIQNAARCEAPTKKYNGRKCNGIALKGTNRCRYHGGYALAKAAAIARYGDKVIVPGNPRKKAWVKLATTTPWPEGLPQRPDLLKLGVVARGRLFEAWFNRLTSPEIYRFEITRERRERT
jgi:hypothetical protein